MKILKIKKRVSKKEIEEIIRYLKKGKVIVFPTDTVYGLLADATNREAIERIFKIKKRSSRNFLPIFVKDIKMAKEIAKIKRWQEEFLKKVWPGKVTAVLERKRKKLKIYGVSSKNIALRVPNHRLLLKILEKINFPLSGTSANLSGLPPSTKIRDILNQFKNEKEKPDLIIDSGNLPRAKPSVILDLTTFPIKILRL